MGEGLDLLGILLRRKWLIALGAVVGLGLGILYYSRQPTVYQSAAQMLIQEKNSSPLPIEGFEDQLFSGGGRYVSVDYWLNLHFGRNSQG